MSDQKVSFTIEVRDDGSAVVKGFEGTASRAFRTTADEAEKSGARQISTFDKMKASMATLRQHWLAITAATAGAVYIIRDTVNAFLESDQAQNRLAKSLANTNQLTRQNYITLLEYASEIQKTTSISDDYVNAQMAIMLSYRDQEGRVMTITQAMATMSAAADLAIGKDMDLATASDLLGKAFAGRTEMLSRYGIVLSESIPAGEKFNAVLNLINASMGGAAQADMNSYAGQVRYLQEVWGDVKENIGLGFIKIAEAGILAFKSLGYSVLQIEILFINLSQKVDTLAAKIPFIGKYFAEKAADDKAALDALSVTADAAMADISRLQGMLLSGGGDPTGTYKNQAALQGVGDTAKDTAEKVKQLTDETARLREEQLALRDALIEADHAMVEQINRVEELIEKYPEMDAALAARFRERAAANDPESIKWYEETELARIEARRKSADAQIEIAQDQSAAEQETYRETSSFFSEVFSGALAENINSVDDFMDRIKNKMISGFADVVAAMVAQWVTGIGVMNANASVGVDVSASGGLGGSSSPLGLIGNLFGGGGSNVFSGMLGQLTGMNSLLDKVIGPAGLLVDTHALPAGVAGPTLPPGLTTLGSSVAAIGGAYGLYSAYESGSPLGGAMGGAGLGLGATSLFAAAGSVVPVVGTIVGAVVGAIVGALGGNDAEQARIRRMEDYNRALQNTVENLDKINSLEELYADKKAAMALEDTKYIDAAISYGDVSGKGVDELYNIGALSKEYRLAIEEFGGSSLQAISVFNKMDVEYGRLFALSAGWTKAGQTIAAEYMAIYQKVRELQLKAVMEELSQGATTFTAAMEKINMLDLGEAETATAQYGAALSFLTTNALPALSGELTTARDLLKETKEEMEQQADAAAGLDVKVQLLTSDLALTEEQLRAIKEGAVNIDMISLARMMGDWDAQIVMVTNDSKEAVSVWKTLETATASLQASLAGVAEKFKGIDDVNPALVELYQNMQLTLSAVTMLAEAAQKLEKLDDVFKSMSEHIEAADLAGLSADLVELTDIVATTAAMFEQLAATMRDIGAMNAATMLSGLAGLLGPLGQIIMAAQLIIDLFLVGQGVFQRWMRDMTQDEGIADWVQTKIIDPLKEAGPIGKWLAEQFEKNWFDAGEEVKKSMREVYAEEYQQQQLSGAASVYQGYAEKERRTAAGYTNETDIGKQIDDVNFAGDQAYAALMQERIKAKSEGRDDDAALIKEWMATIGKGVKEEIEKITTDWKDSIAEISETAGMTAAEKQMHDLNRWYEEQANIARELGEPLQQVTDAYEAQRKALLSGVMEGINDTIATAGMTDQEKQVYAVNRQYDDIIDTLNTYGATAENIAAAELARKIALGDLAAAEDERQRQEMEARADEWDRIIESIQQKITDLGSSKYNIWANPAQMTENYGQQFQAALSTLQGSSAEDFGKNYDSLQSLADKYLEQALSTYGNTAEYASVYQTVMAGLNQALGLGRGQQTEVLSEYERRSVTAAEDSLYYNQMMSDYLATLPDQKTATDTTNATLDDLRGDISTSNSSLNGILSEVSGSKNYYNAFVNNQNRQTTLLEKIEARLSAIEGETKTANKKKAEVVSVQIDGREIARANYEAGLDGYRNH